MDKLNVAQVAKWIGIVDGAVMAAAVALGRGYPPWQPAMDTVAEVGGCIATALGAFGHLSAGTNQGKNFS